MAIALVMPGRDTRLLERELAALLPGTPVRVWPDCAPEDEVRFAVLWQQPPGALARFAHLAAVTSYGAGVDGVLADPALPPELPVGRVVDPGLVEQMTAYVLADVLYRVREFERYRGLQAEARWAPRQEPVAAHVGLLGLGRIGEPVARAFAGLGFPVSAWCRRERAIEGVTLRRGADGLARLAAESDVVVCLLPLTPATRGLLGAPLFQTMRPGSHLVHVGRGAQLNEDDLLAALDAGAPATACLDVFAREPLPTGHPFWHHPGITVTPHVAAITDPRAAARRIAESWRRVQAGDEPLDAVDRDVGY